MSESESQIKHAHSPGERRSGIAEDDSSKRQPSERDRDRILYSEGFRRLGGVTQVASGTPAMGLHDRLTHSLKVEQVGLSIVSRLREISGDAATGLDKGAVAAACLGHDLGHPPFGHAGETELHRLLVCPRHLAEVRTFEQRQADPCVECKLEDGFEGNAQSYRILTALAVHRDSENRPLGLDLTRVSLAAVSKYPWTRGAAGRKRGKWGAYDCDTATMSWMQGSLNRDPSLDAQAMDWADDISYAVHDIEDFYRVGLVPIDDYNKEETEAIYSFLEYAGAQIGGVTDADLEGFNNVKELFPTERFSGQTSHLAALDRLRGTLLTQFIEAARLVSGSLKITPEMARINALLKQLTWYHVIDDPTLANIQTGQQRVLREVFEILRPRVHEIYRTGSDATPKENELRRLPHDLRRAIKIGQQQLQMDESTYKHAQILDRGLIDFMSGLSDRGAYELHARLKGREGFGHL